MTSVLDLVSLNFQELFTTVVRYYAIFKQAMLLITCPTVPCKKLLFSLSPKLCTKCTK